MATPLCDLGDLGDLGNLGNLGDCGDREDLGENDRRGELSSSFILYETALIALTMRLRTF